MLLGSMLGLPRRQIAEAMDEVAEFAEIAPAHLDTPVKRYSSGMRARLSFAASLTRRDLLVPGRGRARSGAE